MNLLGFLVGVAIGFFVGSRWRKIVYSDIVTLCAIAARRKPSIPVAPPAYSEAEPLAPPVKARAKALGA